MIIVHKREENLISLEEEVEYMSKILNKCPICGGKLIYSQLMQYSNIYSIKINGTLSKNRIRKEDNGPMECGFISCVNEECDFNTDTDHNCDAYPNIKIWQEDCVLFYENIDGED